MLAERWQTTIEGARRWCPPPVETVVVVPHPDDESLSTGGLIAHQRRHGVAVTVVAVTDGEAAYPDRDPEQMGAIRRIEQNVALGVLGVAREDIVRLSLPDGAVADHVEELTDALRDLVPAQGLVAAPWTHDVHPDHEACGRAALAAVAGTDVTSIFGLFWAWHHQRVGCFESEGGLLSLPLDTRLASLRERALQCHRSQLVQLDDRPILERRELEPTRWPFELFVPGRAVVTA